MISLPSLRRLAKVIDNLPESSHKNEANVQLAQANLGRFFGVDAKFVKIAINACVKEIKASKK